MLGEGRNGERIYFSDQSAKWRNNVHVDENKKRNSHQDY